MIAYIKGTLAYKGRTLVVVETAQGLGYEIEISLATYNRLPNTGEATQIFTHLQIREDAHTLYGFAEMEEKEMFLHLTSVSGVGSNTARVLLSALSPAEIRAAVIAEKDSILRNAKGIGPKNAKRIVLELKDKFLKDSGAESESIAQALTQGGTMADNFVREEALAALVALGFNKIQVQKTLNQILRDDANIRDAGDLIKRALGQLT